MASCKDSVFTLENATIRFDPAKDQRFLIQDSLGLTKLDTIYVRAEVRLNNLEFEPRGSLGGIDGRFQFVNYIQPKFNKIKFERPFSISQAQVTYRIIFNWSRFESNVKIIFDKSSIDNEISLRNCIFQGYSEFEITKGAISSNGCLYEPPNNQEVIYATSFEVNHEESFVVLSENKFNIRDNKGRASNVGIGGKLYTLRLFDNTFQADLWMAEVSVEDITMIGNTFNGLVNMTNVEFGSYKSELYYDQLGGKVGVYSNEDLSADIIRTWRPESHVSFSDSIASERFFNVYRRLTEHFKSRGNTRDFNKLYIEMKDFETMQLQYYSEQDNSLAALFSWRVNQLLGVISDYGTRPAKSLVYSIYIVLLFAFIYIFFPNSWDTQGRKRLIDRYTFFFKYLRKDAGIHEVYLENRQENLMQYEEFKNLINESGQKVPKFFTATGLPIYKWAVSGTNLSASFLRRFDIIKGRWEDLPKSKRIWKSILITGAFIVAIIYDLFIKVLNALMLSVNAFTTLGFGEIPIKGVPRYLAIIEGFIGWFMLTIFSVALISQLLN